MDANIVLLGLPGSGKSTLARRVSEKFDFAHVDTGKLVEMETQKGTESGQQMLKYISEEELVPDQLIFELVNNAIDNNLKSRGLVFDGYPKTVEQAKHLDEKINEIGSRVHGVFLLGINRDKAKNRIIKNKLQKGLSEEEINEAQIQNKIQQEGNSLRNLAQFYKNKKILYQYNADAKPESTEWAISEIVNKEMEKA